MKLKLVFVIVDKNKAEKVVRALEEHGLRHPQAALGTGTAPSALSELLGTGETEKVVIHGTAEESVVPGLYAMLKEKFAFEEKNTGIAFTVPVKSVGGPATLALLAGSGYTAGREVKK
ncbi:MAG TPA: hypothetical protein IAC16_05665 [Candidatus Limadaptatus stercoravium]|nr:hypothetical protein [Candidatus Limadaptatus stercoravium]